MYRQGDVFFTDLPNYNFSKLYIFLILPRRSTIILKKFRNLSEEHKSMDNEIPRNFIIDFINEDLAGRTHELATRFPPEPNGYLHIGHAKSICLNFGLAKMYGGTCNMRFDDTNPAKEDEEYVNAILEDVKWLGFDFENRLFFASDYFDKFYEFAVRLIEKGKAFVCDLTQEELQEYRGTFSKPGKESPYRNRSIEENLQLFEEMKAGKYKDGEKTLRAKIDMSSPNINMRDPVIYRIAHVHHHNTGDKWCIYPMYDYAHPLEDAVEEITHSLCSLEFENNRPLYNWFVDNVGFDKPPRQIEFAKLSLTNAIMGKRHMRLLVENGDVDGWDDPRMLTLSGIRRRGYTPDIIRNFCEIIGLSKADNRVDIALLEHCARDVLKTKSKSLMAVLDPIKVIITNYEGTEMLKIENSAEVEEMGTRQVPFSGELYIEREDFLEDAPKKYFRLTPGKEVRLKGAYYILCNEVIKDEQGNIIELHCTYDKETKSGTGFTGRKVKGTVHWVCAKEAVPIEARIYDYLVIDDPNEESGYRKNPDSLKICNGVIEPAILDMTKEDRFQFIRNGYFALDPKLTTKEKLVVNQIVPLKSSFSIGEANGK